MEQVPFAVLLLLPFSVAGLGALLRRVVRRGGAVETLAFTRLDLVVAVLLSVFFAFLSWGGFRAPHHEITTITVPAIWLGEFLQIVVVLGVLCSLAFRGIPFRETFGVARLSLFRSFVYALGWTLLVLPLVVAVMVLVTSYLPKQDIEEQMLVAFFRSEVRQHHYAGIMSMAITAAVLAPAMEEFLFRGYLYPVFKRYLTGPGSAILTGIVFAALHTNLAALGGLFVLALCLTAAYEWSGSLLVPMGIHATFNGLNLLVMYLGAVHSNS